MSSWRAAKVSSLLVLALMSFGCLSHERDDKKPKVPELHELVLSAAAPEEQSAELFSSSHATHREVLAELANVAKEPLIKGLFLRLSPLGGAWGRASELKAALARVRKAGKPVHCHFDMLDNVGYAVLASSCDRISMGPTGLLMLTGVQAETVYAKDLLDMAGLQAELLQVGRFKGAADALTRSDMPSDVREVLNLLVDDLQASLRTAIGDGRDIDSQSVQTAIDTGPHDPRSALDAKLVDAITFDDEARAKAKAAAHAQRVVRPLHDDTPAHPDLSEIVKLLLDGNAEKASGKRVCVAYLTGTISDEEDETAGSGAASGRFVSAMRRIADDGEIKAMVLRIDSPGGSALASDKMWHAVRRVAKRKPVVISVGDMAASGGYYVASAGSEIFAEEESLVGSIGVVGGKIVGEDLAARLGIHPTALRRGQNAGWMSPFHPFSPSERAAVERSMQHTYQKFLSRVRMGRKLDPAKLALVAEGRIMSGKRALQGGLVDAVGGLSDALARARSQGGLPEDSAVEIWPKQRALLERATRLFAGAESHASPLPALLSRLPGLAQSPVVSAFLSGDRGPLAVLPFALKVE